ncbi:hypothetical protein VST35_33330, partial [Pseudomonas aeruginosa]
GCVRYRERATTAPRPAPHPPPLPAPPRIRRVADLAAAHPAFRQAHPANQPDTPAA